MLPAARRRRPGFGISLPTSGPFSTAANIFAVAERAEASDFDDVWVNDHFSYPPERHHVSAIGAVDAPGETDPNYIESLVSLAAVGARAKRIGVAVHALVLPLRDPRLVAKQLAAIDVLSGGGLTVAPGIGGSRFDFVAAGVRFEHRGRLLDEHLAVLAAMFGPDAPVSFEGRTIKFAGVWAFPRPRSLQLWITGDGEPALRRVVRYGTGWFSGHGSIEDFEARGALLDRLAVEAGRDPAEFERASDLLVCVARTREEALAQGGETLRRRRGGLDRALTRDALGSVDEVVEQLAQRLGRGRTYLELRPIAPSMAATLEMIELLAAEVVPALRVR